jgi:hypothetical protein
VGTVVISEVLPFSELLSGINIALVREQLVELLLVGSVGSFHLAVELRCPRFEVDVSDPLVGYAPVEPCLELMSVIGSDGVDPERGLLDRGVDEVGSA